MKLLISLVLIFGFACNSYANEKVRGFIETLPPPYVSILDWFFHNCIQSFGGYVLYGDKPVAIEYLFAKEEEALYLSEWNCAKAKAFSILREWNQNCEEKEYPILFCEYGNTLHMILINRKAFIKIVNQNISLFRYTLGRTITAEDLLSELIKNQGHFYDVIKDDTALLGILLGYGVENSLIVSRWENLLPGNSAISLKAFPFFNSHTREKPSLGFMSLEKERQSLSNFKYSRDLKNFSSFELPPFGCNPDSKETQDLLETYEKNRNELLLISKKEGFLEKTLEKLFTNTSGQIRLPKLPEPSTFQLPNRNDLSELFAEVVLSDIEINKPAQHSLLKAFLKGVADRDKELKMEPCKDPEDECLYDWDLVQKQLKACRNLLKASSGMKQMISKKDWTCLIENGIYYKRLKAGNGTPATPKIKNATFHVSYRFGYEKKLNHFMTIIQGDVTQLIPGIAHVLIGMKRGEERLVCIHPHYSYGSFMYPESQILFVELQLMDFEEGEAEAKILPTCDLEPKAKRSQKLDNQFKPLPFYHLDTCSHNELLLHYKNLLHKKNEIQRRKFYNYGIIFWSSIKQSGIELDFKEFVNKLDSSKNGKQFIDPEKKKQFISDFKSYLFDKEYKKGAKVPFLQYSLSLNNNSATIIR